jgi:hypothetical protein
MERKFDHLVELPVVYFERRDQHVRKVIFSEALNLFQSYLLPPKATFILTFLRTKIIPITALI